MLRVSSHKLLVAGAAAALSAFSAVGSEPAEAAWLHGGFRGAGVGAWHGGWGPGWGWGGRYWRGGNGYWNNGWWGPAFAGGLLLVAATYPYWGGYYGYPYYGYGYDSGCWAYRPAYDRWGRYIGRVLVNMC